MSRRIVVATVFGGLALMCAPQNPSNAQQQISFARDIQPILQANCWTCHGQTIQLSKLDLRTRDGALKGGDRGAAIVPGRSDDSRLYRLVAGLEKPRMPLDGELTADQIARIKAWIEQGAHWDEVVSDTARAGASSAALAALENMEISPEARSYWAFKLPVQSELP